MGCGKGFSLPSDLTGDNEDLGAYDETYVREKEWLEEKIKNHRKFVITSAQSNTDTNEKFLKSLLTFCKHNKAQLLVIPIKYRNPTSAEDESNYTWSTSLQDYMIENNFKLHPNLKVLGALKINATAENPMTGLDPISKGDSVIIGHNQLQMKTLAVQQSDFPVIMSSTGTVSEKDYSISKMGYKAQFNHSFSAVLVELPPLNAKDDNDVFHIRHLNFDGRGFFDLSYYYLPTKATKDVSSVEAIVTGDEHALFTDPVVKSVTYMSQDSIVKTLKPKFIVRHDVLDCYTVSHHHRHSVFTQYAKYKCGMNKIEDELNLTIQYIKETSPILATNLIVPSNHNDHLTRWLNETDPKYEPWNAVLYHKLMYRMLEHTNIDSSGTVHPNPFELYCGHSFKNSGNKVEFLSRNTSYKIKEIEIGLHGDKGQNGSRGSRKQLSTLPSKTIIGHSHSPGIEKGCYQVGTSSYLKLEYTSGPSSWLHTHCLIYSNGKRQLINIIRGKWRGDSKIHK
jgi:hypothetical protein